MDKDFNVLCPSIYWTDTRSVKEVEFLKENYSEIIDEQVLHKADTIWTLPQLMWLKNNKSDIWSKVDKIFFAKDFVRHKLTGDYATDYIEAQGSMMFDSSENVWSRELLDIIEFPAEKMPKVLKPTDIAGKVTQNAAEDTGLIEGTPVLCGTTDTVMEVLAAGAIEEKQITVKLATAGRICVITDKAYPNKHFVNYSHIIDGLWYPGTATKSCAASYRWYRDTFGESYKELDLGAETVPIGCNGLIFSPYLNGELTPYADPKLCGSFVGIRAGHTKAHFSRAVLEGVAMSLMDCKDVIDNIGIKYEAEAFIIGGGAYSPLWRQIVSDALNLTLIQKEVSDSSLGSAMLAAVYAGFFKDLKEALNMCTKIASVTKPNKENHEIYKKLQKKYNAVYDALKSVYHNDL